MRGTLTLGVLILAVLATGTVALAAGLDGQWLGTVETPNGPLELTYTFKVEGANLTGSIASQMGELPISNGKVDGDSFSFDLELQETVIEHEGLLSGDSIKLKSIGPWGENEMTLTRAAAE